MKLRSLASRVGKSKNTWLVLTALALVIIALMYVVTTNSRIDQLTNSSMQQSATIEGILKRVNEYTYNPQTLGECINNASSEYTNYIKLNGETIVGGEKPSYSLSEKAWKEADSKYKAAKDTCESMFGKAN